MTKAVQRLVVPDELSEVLLGRGLPAKLPLCGPEEHIVNERGLPGARDTGNDRQRAERNVHVHSAQVVEPRAPERETRTVHLADSLGQRDRGTPRQIPPRSGVLDLERARRALIHHLPTLLPRCRPKLDNVVR